MSERRIIDPDLLREMREADLDAHKGLDAHWDWWLQTNIPNMVQRALDHRHLLLQHVERLEEELVARQPQAEWKDRPDEPGWWVWFAIEELNMDSLALSWPAGIAHLSERQLKLEWKPGHRWLRIPDPPIPTE